MKSTLCLVFFSTVHAANWAVLTAGSKTYENYRHQADVCRAYHMLRSKGFDKKNIITMAYDDIAQNKENPFPGKIFNEPDDGEGQNVYAGCELDYTGDDVTPENFAGILLGNATGRVLESTSDDNVFLFYVDHGAPGFIEFPNDDVMHAEQFQQVLTEMKKKKVFKNMLIYIEACESGSMLDGFSLSNVYAVTAVGPTVPSLGTYCGYQAMVNGTQINTCLGDLFSVMFMKYVEEEDGSRTLQEFFETVRDNVASYASLHYGKEINMQYGDENLTSMKISDFFYGSGMVLTKERPAWKIPKGAFSAPRLAMDRATHSYSDAAARPTYKGKSHWREMRVVSKTMKTLMASQEATQQMYWSLIETALPDDESLQERAWVQKMPAKRPSCEIAVHNALVKSCKGKADMVSSYALQFHQVVVNLCKIPLTGWRRDASLGVLAAKKVCGDMDDSVVVV